MCQLLLASLIHRFLFSQRHVVSAWEAFTGRLPPVQTLSHDVVNTVQPHNKTQSTAFVVISCHEPGCFWRVAIQIETVQMQIRRKYVWDSFPGPSNVNDQIPWPKSISLSGEIKAELTLPFPLPSHVQAAKPFSCLLS